MDLLQPSSTDVCIMTTVCSSQCKACLQQLGHVQMWSCGLHLATMHSLFTVFPPTVGCLQSSDRQETCQECVPAEAYSLDDLVWCRIAFKRPETYAVLSDHIQRVRALHQPHACTLCSAQAWPARGHSTGKPGTSPTCLKDPIRARHQGLPHACLFAIAQPDFPAVLHLSCRAYEVGAAPPPTAWQTWILDSSRMFFGGISPIKCSFFRQLSCQLLKHHSPPAMQGP